MMKASKKSKRWISLLLCVLMMVPMLVLPASAASVEDFTDVPSTAWYYEAVKYSVDKGIFAGMSDSTFEPQTALTRGMFVQTMANLATNYDDTFSSKYFTDIPSEAWYEKSANWAYYNYLISGTAEKTFSATTNITREQAATILYSYAMRTGGYTNIEDINAAIGYSDFSSVSAWAAWPMTWAVEQGIMAGVGDNKLDPKGTLTRAQAAQLFTNIQGIIDDKPYVYSWGYADDLGLDYEETIGLTYNELVEALGEPVEAGANSNNSKYYYTFEAFPDIDYVFDASEGSYSESGVPLDNQTPIYMVTSLANVLPDIVGLKYGEAIKLTEGDLYIYYESAYYPPDFQMCGYYDMENYYLGIVFDSPSEIGGDSGVYICEYAD